ncbi:MAG TPA: hypothetical protein VJ583_04375 [Nitrososphaeraceae archaeon]|nr:hypothetical protein [Nitrososphaeraceae archaeon]
MFYNTCPLLIGNRLCYPYFATTIIIGRTIPSFRIAAVLEEKEWKSFRKCLNKNDKKLFAEMFSTSGL